MIDDLTYAKRAATRFLESLGVEVYPESDDWRMRAADDTAYAYYEDADLRYQIWMAESLLFGLRQIERYRVAPSHEVAKLALRAYGQVREYKGHLRGFPPLAISDHVTTLQNAIEWEILR